jgi:hypothetical protein
VAVVGNKPPRHIRRARNANPGCWLHLRHPVERPKSDLRKPPIPARGEFGSSVRFWVERENRGVTGIGAKRSALKVFACRIVLAWVLADRFVPVPGGQGCGGVALACWSTPTFVGFDALVLRLCIDVNYIGLARSGHLRVGRAGCSLVLVMCLEWQFSVGGLSRRGAVRHRGIWMVLAEFARATRKLCLSRRVKRSGRVWKVVHMRRVAGAARGIKVFWFFFSKKNDSFFA